MSRQVLIWTGLSILLSGCASAGELESEYAPINAHNYKSAAERLMKQMKLQSLHLEGNYRGEAGRDRDSRETEGNVQIQTRDISAGKLEQRGADKPILFIASDCVSGDSCGCGVSIPFQFAKSPDGNIVIFDHEPDRNVHTVRRIGPCSYGCGVPNYTPDKVFELPITDINKVTTVPAPFELHEVEEKCLFSTPAP